MGTFYLGPLAALREIPAPADPMEVPPTLIGAVHESLSGAVSVDRVAMPRRWAMAWRVLPEDTLTYLAAVGLGLVAGPLRLLDPLVRNRLGRQVATGGSMRRSVDRWAAYDGSSIAWVPLSDPPAGIPVRGAVSWTLPDLSGTELTVASGREASTGRVPVLPGETVRVSGWARGTTGTGVALGADTWDAAGVSVTTEGALTALDATVWSPLSFTYPVPGDGSRPAVSPYLRAPAGQPAATVQITGLQVCDATAPDVWTLGGGTPVVIATESTDVYELVDKHSYSMVLREVMP